MVTWITHFIVFYDVSTQTSGAGLVEPLHHLWDY